MTDVVVRDSGDLLIRLLRDDDADVRLLAAWLSDDRVLEWYGGRDQPVGIDVVRSEWSPSARAADGVIPGIAVLDGDAVGYVQWYCVERHAQEYGIAGEPELSTTWGLDLFVGRPELWGTGVGTRITRLLVDHLLVEMGATRVVIDPRVVNVRAIAAYEKCGFRKVRVIPHHERHEGEWFDNWLMEIRADDDPVGLTARLARIDSTNPSLVPGAPGEGAMAEAVVAWCDARGIEVHREAVGPGRDNVVACRRGHGGGRSLLLNAHTDTVGVGSSDTSTVRLGAGRLEGRGVLDTKGGLAAALIALSRVPSDRLAGDVIVAAVVDEEHASTGTASLVEQWPADAAIVLEPTDLAVVVRHRGYAVIDVDVTGRSAHTSRPELGVNAAAAAARIAVAVGALDRAWEAAAVANGVPLIDAPSVLVNRIGSVGEQFTVPAFASMSIEVRTTAGAATDQVAAVVAAVDAAAGDASVRSATVLERSPMGVDVDHPLIAVVTAAVARVVRAVPATVAAPFWTDAALHGAAGVPAIVVGPVGEGLHEDLEWVTTTSLRQLTVALVEVIERWCAPD